MKQANVKGVVSEAYKARGLRIVRTITCPICNETVTKRIHEWQIYCSSKCWGESKRLPQRTELERKCKQCGGDFEVNWTKSAKRFCSSDCFKASRHSPLITAMCKMCWKIFTVAQKQYDNGRGTYCSIPCRLADPDKHKDMIAKLRAYRYDRNKPTKPEICANNIMRKLGIEFETQYRIHYWTVDAYIPDIKCVVQIDGDYWHGNPEIYPEPTLHIRKNMQNDIRSAAYFAKCGYGLVRVWASELKENPEVFVERLTEAFTCRQSCPEQYPA